MKANEYQTGSWKMGDVFTAKPKMGVGVEGGKGPECGVPIGERVALTAQKKVGSLVDAPRPFYILHFTLFFPTAFNCHWILHNGRLLLQEAQGQ